MSARQQSTINRLQSRVREFNKHVLNPFMLRLAGRPGAPIGVVRHVGRQTGRVYDTPVLMGTMSEGFVIPLLYGADTDWYRNVRADGGCTVVWQGRAYRAESPRLVSRAVAQEAFPAGTHRLLGAAGAGQFLRVERDGEVPGSYEDVVARYRAGPAVAGVVAAVAVMAAWWVWRRRE